MSYEMGAMSQVVPAGPVPYGSAPASAPNAVFNLVGTKFGLVPRVLPTQGCGSPVLPQGIHIVPVAVIDSPAQVTSVGQQVVNQAQPTPIASVIDQQTCCGGFGFKTMLSNQEFKDPQGRVIFALSDEHSCCCPPILRSRDGNNQEIGYLEWGKQSCGTVCGMMCCLFLCRTASTPEWAWLKAVDPAGRERLTLRHQAKVGECLCCAFNCPERRQDRCCAALPDIPFVEKSDIYGPMPTPGAVGTIEVRGAFGWDQWCCGIMKDFGARPEMVTSLTLSPNLSYEDTVLAIQLATQRTQNSLMFRAPHGQVQQVKFLRPQGQVMKL